MSAYTPDQRVYYTLHYDTELHWNNVIRCPVINYNVRFCQAHHIPFWFRVVGSKIRDVGGKALVEPQVIPPPGGHQVPKPLRGQSIFK